MDVCLRRFCLNINVVWTIVCSEVFRRATGCSGECCFGMIYVEFYGGCNFVMISAVEVCVDYGCVYVFHVVCVVESCCFMSLGVTCCVMLLCSAVGEWGVVILVHPVAILSAVFCVICILLMFVSNASGDHIVEMCSSMGLVMALYVASVVSFCFSMLLM